MITWIAENAPSYMVTSDRSPQTGETSPDAAPIRVYSGSDENAARVELGRHLLTLSRTTNIQNAGKTREYREAAVKISNGHTDLIRLGYRVFQVRTI